MILFQRSRHGFQLVAWHLLVIVFGWSWSISSRRRHCLVTGFSLDPTTITPTPPPSITPTTTPTPSSRSTTASALLQNVWDVNGNMDHYSPTALLSTAQTDSLQSSSSSAPEQVVPSAHKAMECRSSAMSLIQYRSTRGRVKKQQQYQQQHEGDIVERGGEDDDDDESVDKDVALPVIRLVQKRKPKEKLLSRTTTSTKTRIKQPSSSTGTTSLSSQNDSNVSKLVQKRRVITLPEQQQRTNGADLPYESALQALQAYHAIHGDLIMPRRFVVPHAGDDEKKASSLYPKEWRGVNLASSVYNMKWWQRHVKQRPKRVAQLNQLGFVWERLQPEWNLVLEALCTYRNEYGNVRVPIHFVVPHTNSTWPKATWGIPLGSSVYRIRSRDDFLRGCHAQAASRREQLDGLGFCWDVSEERFQKFYRILLHFAHLQRAGGPAVTAAAATTTINHYNNIHNSQPLRVPSTFVVPSNDETNWPNPEYWNYPLGAKCTAVRQKQLYIKGKPERKRQLAEIGFLYWNSGNADLGWLHVVHAAAIFSRMHHRKLNVPYHFVVPAPPPSTTHDIDNVSGSIAEDWPWPEHLWGLPLGQRLKDVRANNAYLKGKHGPMRRQQLNTLGFDWKPKRGRPPKG